MATDRPIDAPGLLARRAPHERQVHALDAVVVKLLRERAVGRIVLGRNKDAGGAAVEPVHDARTQDATDSGFPVFAVSADAPPITLERVQRAAEED